MSEVIPDEKQLGEGFAYFRWHSLRWPGCHTCSYTYEPNYCKELWITHER